MSLQNLLQKLKKSDRQYRLLILGLDNAGKTSCLKRLAEENISDILPTHGFNVKSLSVQGIKLDLWDIGGKKDARAFWQNYFDSTNALIYVIDSTDRKRLEETGTELIILLQDERLADIPLLVLANKQDLASPISESELISSLNLKSISGRQWKLQSCSVKTGEGLVPGFEWLIKCFVK